MVSQYKTKNNSMEFPIITDSEPMHQLGTLINSIVLLAGVVRYFVNKLKNKN